MRAACFRELLATRTLIVVLAVASCRHKPSDEDIAKSRALIAEGDAKDRNEQLALDQRLDKAQAAIGQIRGTLAGTLAALPTRKPKAAQPCPASVVDQVSLWSRVAVVGDVPGLTWLSKPPVFPAANDRATVPAPEWTTTPAGAMTQFANLNLYSLLELVAEGRPRMNPNAPDDESGQSLWRSRLGSALDDFERDFPPTRVPPKFVAVYFPELDKAGQFVEKQSNDPAEGDYVGGTSAGWLVVIDSRSHAAVCQYRVMAVQSTSIKTYDSSKALAVDLGHNILDSISSTLPKGWFPRK